LSASVNVILADRGRPRLIEGSTNETLRRPISAWRQRPPPVSMRAPFRTAVTSSQRGTRTD